MKQFTYTVTAPEGLHARPARLLAETVRGLSCSVTIEKGGASAQADRLMALMLLGVGCGDTVTVTLSGEEEEREALNLEAFFRAHL